MNQSENPDAQNCSSGDEDLVCTFASGSKGNSVYVRLDGTQLLIDTGISCLAVRRSLEKVNSSLDRISAVLITHEHTDHIRGLPVISRHPSFSAGIYAPAPCIPYIGIPESRAVGFDRTDFRKSIGNLEVEAFATPHDSAASAGYIIRSEKHSVGICTDLGNVPKKAFDLLSSCDSVIIESNHDRQKLMYGPYPEPLKRRIASPSGHLSNDDCAKTVSALYQCGTRNFLLTHLSETNNLPVLAYESSRIALEKADSLALCS